MVKRQKVSNFSEISPGPINDLPDEILSHILSFLPMQQVMQTRVLSRRWRSLHTSMLSLDFDYTLFMQLKAQNTYSEGKIGFVNFVNKVLEFHDLSNIERFRLACFDCDFYHINTWISVAMEKNVQEIYLDIRGPYYMVLADYLFFCNSLVSFRLNLHSSQLELPASICFTSLKTLHLHSVMFPENKDDPFLKLLSGCPVLENLIIENCQVFQPKVCCISHPTLRNLTMYDCVIPYQFNLNISIPNLISLKYENNSTVDCFLENLSSMIAAYIHVKIGNRYSCMDYKDCFYRVGKLLKGVSTARSLTLSDTTLEQLSNGPIWNAQIPILYNLTKLSVTSGSKEKHFIVIACLILRSPNLESLVIHVKPSLKYQYGVDKEEANKALKKLSSEHLLDRLKVVHFRCFRGSGNEFKFVKLLLGNGKNLERVIIEAEDSDKRMEISSKILKCKMASANLYRFILIKSAVKI